MKAATIDDLKALLKLPVAEHKYDLGSDGTFDPWSLFPLYGSYSSDFDECAIEVLEELRERFSRRDDLGAEMFREMLCVMGLCDYGTSPRVCWPTPEFSALLPAFIEKWKAYSKLHWSDE